MADYSFLSKLLHFMALNSRTVRKISFDLDCMMSRLQGNSKGTAPPVYISGLARAGTTILLEALYSTGMFTTLTYRYMPFVMAPVTWQLITTGQHRNTELKERVHGDRLYINFDSPEAFEEIFWLTFAVEPYVKKSWLEPHCFDSEVLKNYQNFVQNVLISKRENKSPRYLAKNNNNILRIQSLKKAFPEGVIIVPFRNPYDQARSLLRQHKKFLKIHSEDEFSQRYMNWLGHFEFGINFKPFKVNEEVVPDSSEELNEIEFWLRYWKGVYQFLMERHAGDIFFLDYDKFCAEPADSLNKIAKILYLDPSCLMQFRDKVQKAVKYDSETQKIPESINKIHKEMQKIALHSS